MRAYDYRMTARAALRGNWGTSILAMFLAGILGAGLANGVDLTGVLQLIIGRSRIEDMWNMQGFFLPSIFFEDVYYRFMEMIRTVERTTIFSVVVAFVLGGAVRLGVCQYHMRLVLRTDRPSVNALFFRFHIFGKALLMRLLISLLVTACAVLGWLPSWLPDIGMGMFAVRSLASGLLAIVGVVLSLILGLGLSLAPYLLSQNPNLGVTEAMRSSWETMRGRKLRLFCLQLSFIGWMLLCLFSCGIGFLWLLPYMAAAETTFYLDATGQLPQVQAQPQPPLQPPPPGQYGQM